MHLAVLDKSKTLYFRWCWSFELCRIIWKNVIKKGRALLKFDVKFPHHFFHSTKILSQTTQESHWTRNHHRLLECQQNCEWTKQKWQRPYLQHVPEDHQVSCINVVYVLCHVNEETEYSKKATVVAVQREKAFQIYDNNLVITF